MKPMLSSPMPKGLNETSFIESDAWMAEQKLDGHRLLLEVGGREAKGFNRQGDPKAVPVHIAACFDHAGFHDDGWVFDGELVGDIYYVFDIPETPTFKGLQYESRRKFAETLFSQWHPLNVQLVSAASGAKNKQRLLDECREANVEGVIFKHVNSLYLPGTRSKQSVKAKFTETADVVVTELQREGKPQAVTVSLYHNGVLREAGGCKIPVDVVPQLAIGSVIECRYLYGTEDYKLYQPVFLGIRTDKSPDECDISQLKITNKGVLVEV